MNLKQWQRSKKIKAEAEAAAKRTVERVLNAVKEPAMSEFKAGDYVVLVGTGTKDVLLEVVEHMYTPDMHRVKILSTGQYGPVFKNDIRHATPEEIAAGHRIDNDMGDDSHIENHISPLCKSKDV